MPFIFVRNFICLYILFSLRISQAISQSERGTTPTPKDLFSDLPINDPNTRSILKAGENAEDKIRENIILRGSLNKTRCYVGEPVLLTFELLSALTSTSTVKRFPPLPGFQITDITPNNDFPRSILRNGITYNVFTVKQSKLISFAEGNFEIGSMIVDNKVVYTKDKENFSYYGIVVSKPISIKVAPLPNAGKPIQFEGAIGSLFYPRLSIKNDTFLANKNNILYLEIVGRGNFASVTLPSLSWPTGLHHFDVSEKLNVNEKIFPDSGQKIFSIPFIADRSGKYTIPPVQLSYFDPSAESYHVSSKTNSIQLTVLPGVPTPKINVTDVINVQKPGVNHCWWYWVGGIWFFAIFMLVLINRLSNIKAKKLVSISREKAAQEVIDENLNRLNIAFLEIEKLEPGKNHVAELKRICTGYLQNKLRMPGALPDELIETISRIDKDTGAELDEFIKVCEMLLYAPVLPDDATSKKLITDFGRMIKKINRFPV